MKKKRNYNTRLIRDDYSYYVEQVADMFGVDVASVRRWMREEGLNRIPNTRPHLIHSSELYSFIEKRQSARKKPCAGYEVFCFRCQWPRTPKMASAVVAPLPNKSVCYKAICSECGGVMNRTIRASEWNEMHPLAAYLSDATGDHNGVQSTHRECSLQIEEESCLNITA